MEDRYEIRGKIGHGGLGAVYRAYDLRMKREVAIKRIISHLEDDPELQREATKQLVSEAGALAALQHPHIVTVYDVGADEDGPFVVMELINGKTLDDIIENAPLVWSDFRELALQSQEALIAAHELNMIHSDIKPPNIMLTWLPSGKFQIKMVDFGLAVLIHNQSKEEIEQLETVFGSIFFMPPEQFERQTLDVRSDLYSMGCVYYQALSGTYPFNGESGQDVMDAHLNHQVKPLQDVRADIPLWLCDWVMWHINRDREHRPQSARESLTVFLQNDKMPNPKMSRGSVSTKRARLIIPGASAVPDESENKLPVAQPLMPPDPSMSVQLTVERTTRELMQQAQPTAPVSVATAAAPVAVAQAAPTATTTAPGWAPPTAIQRPKAQTTQFAQSTAKPEAVPQVQTSPTPTAPAQTAAPVVAMPPKAPMSNSTKIVIAAILGIVMLILAYVLVDRMERNKITSLMNQFMAQAGDENVKEIRMNADLLDIVLTQAAFVGQMKDEERLAIYTGLVKAVGDGMDVDSAIYRFVMGREMLPEVRKSLIGDVLRMRRNASVIPLLHDYAKTSPDKDVTIACYKATRSMLTEAHFDYFLDVLMKTNDATIRSEAETSIMAILKTSPLKASLTGRIVGALGTGGDVKVKNALIRLLGFCGTDQALDKLKQLLTDADANTQKAAITALGEWQDDKAIPVLMNTLNTGSPELRSNTFMALLKVASHESIIAKQDYAKEVWTNIATVLKSTAEKMEYIRRLVVIPAPWPKPMVEAYVKDPDPKIQQLAKKGLVFIKEQESANKKPNP